MFNKTVWSISPRHREITKHIFSYVYNKARRTSPRQWLTLVTTKLKTHHKDTEKFQSQILTRYIAQLSSHHRGTQKLTQFIFNDAFSNKVKPTHKVPEKSTEHWFLTDVHNKKTDSPSQWHRELLIWKPVSNDKTKLMTRAQRNNLKASF